MPHTGRTDGRLRLHAPLHVPASHRWRIRAGDPKAPGSTREWREGEILLLDDSFEHELWGDGGPRCCNKESSQVNTPIADADESTCSSTRSVGSEEPCRKEKDGGHGGKGDGDGDDKRGTNVNIERGHGADVTQGGHDDVPSQPPLASTHSTHEECYRLILIVDLWHPDLDVTERSAAARM